MAIFSDFVNASISQIDRPQRSGPGGDEGAPKTLVEATIAAIRQPFNVFATAGNSLARDADSAIALAENTFWIDLTDANEVIRDVQPGDLMTWVSAVTGGPSNRTIQDEILRVNVWEAPNSLLFQRPHVELLTRGRAH